MGGRAKDFLHGIKENWGKNKLFLWILGVAGVILLILPSLFHPRDMPAPTPATERGSYQVQLQEELESMLSAIDGVGKVRVMLTLDDEQEVIYAKNADVSSRTTHEEDNQGGIREQVEYNQQGQLVIVRTNNQEEPVVEKILKPRIRGVLVVAANADSPWVRERLTHAVQGVLDVQVYRITIQKGR